MAKESKARHERRVAKLTEELKGIEIKLSYAHKEIDRYRELGFTGHAQYLTKQTYPLERQWEMLYLRLKDLRAPFIPLSEIIKRESERMIGY